MKEVKSKEAEAEEEEVEVEEQPTKTVETEKVIETPSKKRASRTRKETPKKTENLIIQEDVDEEIPLKRKKIEKIILQPKVYLKMTERFKITSNCWSDINIENKSSFLALGNKKGEIFILEIKTNENQL